MKLRTLGRTKWEVSEIGFGAWGIGQRWWGPTDDRESLKAISTAWDQGVNFFDTAFVYGDGHSEELLGKALAEKAAIIATKIPPKNHEWPGNPTVSASAVYPREWIVSCTERSLRKLNRGSLHLTQFHTWSDAWLDNDEWKEAIRELKQAGKIRAFGVSINDHDPNSALQLVDSGLVDTVQVIFNIFDQSPLEKLFPLCSTKNVGVIVRVPLDEGGLSGTLTPETRFEGDDFRQKYFGGERLNETVRRVEKLKALFTKDVASVPELALRFVLSFCAVSTVIPGMRTSSHVVANVAFSEKGSLAPALLNELKKHAWKRNFYGLW